jgi:L-alanine-DL-glutamate epimerase-like enolase superfamily enzyme
VKICRVSSRLVEVHDEDRDAPPSARQPRTWPVVTLRIGTDQGVDGLGIAFTLGGLNRALFSIVEELAERLIGQDPTRIETVLSDLRALASTGGKAGLYLMAQAAVDIALWDIRGKMAGLPLWRLVGGRQNHIGGYASGAVHRGLSDSEAAEAAALLAQGGFGWIKMHLGLPGEHNPRREVERARLVREAVGPDIRLGCDINERWRVDEAVEIGRRLEAVHFSWIEDPVRHDDYSGLARITEALTTPVMAGESNSGMAPFRIMLERRCVDLLMIDVMMVGGITAWLKVAGMAEVFGIPVVSHLLPEIQAHLVAGIPNGLMSEHKSWIWTLFNEGPAFDRGAFRLGERPGLGLEFNPSIYGAAW